MPGRQRRAKVTAGKTTPTNGGLAPEWDPPGVSADGNGGAHVALWADGATAVDLCVFDEAGAETRIPLTDRLFGVFNAHVPDLPVGSRYGFRVDGPWDPAVGHRWNPNKLLLDPYAKAIDGSLRLHEAIFGNPESDDLIRNDLDSAPYVPRSVVVGPDDFDWGPDRPPGVAWSDTVIYEAHVRGLTMRHPKVPSHLRGTYAGVAHPAVIEHLIALGVTAVELLPVHHFVDEVHLLKLGLTDYWGYNSIGYFAPHARYAATGSRGEQVTEFQQMVKDLHAAGLEVILDVVYNHTAEGNQLGPTLCYRGIDNPTYYRLREGGRTYTDDTGCGNTLDLSHAKVLQVVMDSLRYWVTQMHVDGFRFDLASALARSGNGVDMHGTFMTTIQQDPVLRRVKLIAEPWDIGPGGYQVGEFPPPWSEWNGKYRDSIRDFWRGSTGIGELGWRLTGSADLYASQGRRPFASINFITAHDGFTMHDLVSYEHKHNEANLEGNRDGTDDNRSANYGIEGETDDAEVNAVRRKQVRNLMTTLLLSTGVPMLAAGDELGRTQRGNNNAYCQDNELSWLDWELDNHRQRLLEFVRRVLHLRRDHPAWRRRSFFDGQPRGEEGPKDLTWIGQDGLELTDPAWHDPQRRTVGMYICGSGPDPTNASFLVILHAGWQEQGFVLPDQTFAAGYRCVVDTAAESAGDAGPEVPAAAVISMPPMSMKVFQALG